MKNFRHYNLYVLANALDTLPEELSLKNCKKKYALNTINVRKNYGTLGHDYLNKVRSTEVQMETPKPQFKNIYISFYI